MDSIAYAGELIKQEMIKMLHYDALYYPSDNQIPPEGKSRKRTIPGPESHKEFLDAIPYEEIDQEQYNNAKDLIQLELERLKACTDHGKFSYEHITTECNDQLVLLPQLNKWTKTSIASRRDMLDSSQLRLKTNKAIMTRQGKIAAKTEKKLKVLTAGYVKRNEQLGNELKTCGENILTTYRDINTFNRLSFQEKTNGEQRVKQLQILYNMQLTRHNRLQKEFDDLRYELKTKLDKSKMTANAADKMAEYLQGNLEPNQNAQIDESADIQNEIEEPMTIENEVEEPQTIDNEISMETDKEQTVEKDNDDRPKNSNKIDQNEKDDAKNEASEKLI